MTDLFEDELAAAEAALIGHEETKKAVAIARRKNRTVLRRAKSEEHLAEIMPAIENDTSYHVISHGDIDSMSFLVHLLKTSGPIDRLMISTWCMAMPDIEEIAVALRTKMVGHCHFCVGEIFPGQYGDEYEAIRMLESEGLARVTVAKNHSKVMLGAAPGRDWHFVVESSANANTNPRIEQTAIHTSRDLYEFYAEFYDGLKDLDSRSKLTAAVDAEK